MNEEVLLEKIENLRCLMEKAQSDNRDAHEKIMAKQDLTNGNVKSLQLWRSYITGALAVIVLVGVYIIDDYRNNQKEVKQVLIEHAQHNNY